MEKCILVYYSFEGNTHFVAEEIASRIGCDILRIEPLNEAKSHGVMKFVWGGRQAVMKKTPELKKYEFNPSDYDTIIIGTPVWAWNYSPPIRTFFQENHIVGKKVAVFCCHDGGPGKTLEKMKEELSGNVVLAQADLRSPLKNREKTIEGIEEFIRGIKEA